MDVKSTQQTINVNSSTSTKNSSTQKPSGKNFEDEIKDLKKTDEKKKAENEKKDSEKNIDEAIDGLKDAVDEINKLGQKDEQEENFTDIYEDNILIDNNLNFQDPSDKLNLQTEANTNFNSNGQPFSQFFNGDSEKNPLNSTSKELAEEKSILSTMEENIAIANKNMLIKERNARIQDETGIKKIDTKTNIVIDTIVSYENVIMDKADVDFFAKLVNDGVLNLNEVQHANKSSQVSKTLADLLAKAMNENKPVRIDFDNDISVIIKIDRAGKISADFIPSTQIAEAYLKENLPLLKQRFDENNLEYNELNQRKQKQNSQDNKKKENKNE